MIRAAGIERGADGSAEIAPPASPGGLVEEELRWRLVYRRLRSRARTLMRGERVGHTLAPTALVHEMYLRAMKDRRPPRTPEEFLAASALLMRRILVDWARRRGRVKRGGDLQRIDLHPSRIVDPLSVEGIVAIDRAIDRLDAVHPDAAHVAILRHFGGLTIPEAARVVGVSRRTADRLWAFARAWLARELDG